MKTKTLFIMMVVVATLLKACGGVAATQTQAVNPAAGGNAQPQKGGELTVAYKDDLATLDPAIGYDWTNWPAFKMVFDGLLDYDSGTTLQPRIAESMPQISSDGLTYTFKIRKGVKFQNG